MPLQVGKHSLNLTVSLAFLAFFPLAELPLELQLVGEEHLSPAHILGQGPHVRGDVVTGGLNYWLPQFVRDAQLWGEKSQKWVTTHMGSGKVSRSLMKSLPNSCCP